MVWWPHTPHTYIKQREHVITLLKSSYQVSHVTVCTVFIETMLIVAAFHIHISETSRTLPFWLWRKVERGYRGHWRGICRGKDGALTEDVWACPAGFPLSAPLSPSGLCLSVSGVSTQSQFSSKHLSILTDRGEVPASGNEHMVHLDISITLNLFKLYIFTYSFYIWCTVYLLTALLLCTCRYATHLPDSQRTCKLN